MANIFLDIGTIIIIATLFGYIARFLRQPLIPAYILSGVVIGPLGFGLIADTEVIRTLSEIGIAFLLFVVGMELEFRKLKDIGNIASFGGIVQSIILASLGFLMAYGMGIFSNIESFYIGLVVAFSSTMVVIKVLSDRKELETLHGRIVIGILLMQDLLAIIALASLTNISDFSVSSTLFSLSKVLIIICATFIAGKYAFSPLFRYAAKSQEMLFLLSITMCFLFAFGAYSLGFSIAIGAFAAGIAIANLPYNFEIIGKIKPLRDFFATLFFVSLGMEIVNVPIIKYLFPILSIIFFVVIIKPVIIFLITTLFGYSRRPAFLTAISLSQISEFALIIVAQGVILNQVTHEMLSMTVIVAVVTISISTYLIKFEKRLYQKLAPYLKSFDSVGKSKHLEYEPNRRGYDVILIGYDRIGYSIHKFIRKASKSLIVVDFNPDLIKKLIKEKIPCLYGDIGDEEILDRLDFKSAEIVISTVPEERENIILINKVKRANPKATIFVTASWVHEALNLYDKGADYVILPHFLGGDHVSLILEDVSSDFRKLIARKVAHIEELKRRRDLGHHHAKTSARRRDR